jgi:hypothetical protein
MPPTSIDGTDITGATIDGQDVQEITVDGQTVFTASPIIFEDNFEDQDISDWSNPQGIPANITTTASEGQFGLSVGSGSGNGNFLQSVSFPSSGRISFKFDVRFDFASPFGIVGDFSSTTGNAQGSGFAILKLLSDLKIGTGAGRTDLVQNPSQTQFFSVEVICNQDNTTVESVTVDSTVTTLNEPMFGSGLGPLFGIRTDGGQSPYQLFIDDIVIEKL